MQQQKLSSPKLSKNKNNASSPTLNKDKHYLPSRYALDPNKKDSNLLTLLNSIELNTRQEPKLKINSPVKPLTKERSRLQPVKKKEASEFKPHPMKREESDMQNFKQIFLDPRQEVLSQIQEKAKSQQIVMAKQVCKDYEKLLQFQKGAQAGSPNKQKQEQFHEQQIRQHFQQAIELLQQPQINNSSQSFYEEQIRVEPPEAPNSSIASTISPGSGYAPSVPVLPSKKGTLTELLMRAKAGMSTEDIQKEAHIAFYLGMAYEEMRNHHKAIRFYKRFLGFAKAMEDKIGMALGANRVAVNLFYDHQFSKSISFHHENLKLSDNQNCFAAYYNLGVCHRGLKQHDQAISCLETALEWSRQRGEAESQCITLGQLAVTYKSMELHQKSLDNFESSADVCRRLRKTPLLAENLEQMLLITSHYGLSSSERLFEIASQAYECTKILEKKRSQQQHSCNLGVIIGLDEFKQRVAEEELPAEFQDCQLDQEDENELAPPSKSEDSSLIADYDKVKQYD